MGPGPPALLIRNCHPGVHPTGSSLPPHTHTHTLHKLCSHLLCPAYWYTVQNEQLFSQLPDLHSFIFKPMIIGLHRGTLGSRPWLAQGQHLGDLQGRGLTMGSALVPCGLQPPGNRSEALCSHLPFRSSPLDTPFPGLKVKPEGASSLYAQGLRPGLSPGGDGFLTPNPGVKEPDHPTASQMSGVFIPCRKWGWASPALGANSPSKCGGQRSR